MKLFGFGTILAVLAIVQSKTVQETDAILARNSLKDEALNELDQLISIASESLNKANLEIDTTQSDLVKHKNNIQANGEQRLHEEYNKLNATLQTIKYLAIDYNIEKCLNGNEDALVALPTTILNELSGCTGEVVAKSDEINKETIQSIEESTNTTVSNLENDVNACKTILCLTSAVRQIQNNEVLLPQNIQVEVNKATELVKVASISVDQCLESEVASFVSQGMEIVDKVSNCVDRIMSNGKSE